MIKIDDLLREADSIIEKRASKEVKPAATFADSDEVTKLANLLMESDSDTFSIKKEASAPDKTDILHKVAEALVIAEVINNLDKFNKIAEFEKKAQEDGHSQYEIDRFIVEKLW